MRDRFHQLARQLGEAALGPSGSTAANDVSNRETQYAELRHEPDPARRAERGRLGLLGRLAASACLVRIYSRALDNEEFRACLGDHLESWQERERKARSGHNKRRDPDPPADAFAPPFLWIITATAPVAVLTALRLKPSPDWPAGVYVSSDVLRFGIVVADELPRDRSTLLVRLAAAGSLLASAAEELATLPAGAHERAVAEPILRRFGHLPGAGSR